VNAAGTVNLLEAVRAECRRARVLVVGTGEVYGPQPVGTRVDEEAPFQPVSPYALSKAAADTIAETYARVHGMSLVRTRSFGHLGPGQSARFALPGFARQVAEAEAGAADPMLRVGNLEVVRDLSDVRDVVEAYWHLCERGRPGAAYNVCSGRGVRLADAVDSLVRRSRVRLELKVDSTRLRPADVPYLVGDPARIEGETGWRAAIPLERSLDDLLEEWRARVADGAARDS
jgi:GDP-4-dehydro-6-deoxy-D-mannose reductase